METLYISYDGLLEPLGESQVVSYVRRLAERHAITVLSYEKRRDLRDRTRSRRLAEELHRCGIRWVRLPYHKRPPLLSTGFDILLGILIGFMVCRTRRVRLIHARSYVPSAIALCLKRLCGVKFLFDMRGFWADEKVDAGHWMPTALSYRMAKSWERRFFQRADAIVSLTTAGVRAFPTLGYRIPPQIPIEVIPTCVDLERFAPGPRDAALVQQLRLDGQTVIGSVGTLSSWYLRQPTLRYLSLLARRLERIMVLMVTQEDHATLRQDALAAGIPPAQLVLARAAFADMPSYLRLMDLGVFFIKVSFSKQASAATKLAELLATGVPVVINEGIGDSGHIVRERRVGVVIPEMTEGASEASVEQVQGLLRDPSVAERCRSAARDLFDVRMGIRKYRALYRQLG